MGNVSYSIKVDPQFVKSLKRLPYRIQLLSIKKYKLFSSNPFHPTLKTHRLRGKLRNYYSYRVNYSYRVVFALNDNIITLINIGTHAIYK